MNHLRYKTSRSEVEAVFELTHSLFQHEPACSLVEQLVSENILTILKKLGDMYANRLQKRFTLQLTRSECIAFYLFYVHRDLTAYPFENVIITNIIAKIHQSFTTNS